MANETPKTEEVKAEAPKTAAAPKDANAKILANMLPASDTPAAKGVDIAELKVRTGLHANPLLNFDSYFEILKTEKPEIKDHHKNPIKSFMECSGITMGTKEDFDKIFAKY